MRRVKDRRDELVMIRVKDKGDLYVHQDANWNVIGLILDTTPRAKHAVAERPSRNAGQRRVKDGSLVERYVYTPYGELTVDQETGYGDYDGDSDVDSTDRAAGESGGACRGSGPSGACRALNLDFDNDVDDADLTLFDSLPQGLSRHPGRLATNVSQPFAHQGLLFEPEIGQYCLEQRQLHASRRRFLQRSKWHCRPGSASYEPLNAYVYAESAPMNTRGIEICLTCWEAFGGNPLNEVHCELQVRGGGLGTNGKCHGSGGKPCPPGVTCPPPKCCAAPEWNNNPNPTGAMDFQCKSATQAQADCVYNKCKNYPAKQC